MSASKPKITEKILCEKYLHINNGGITHNIHLRTVKDKDGDMTFLVSRVTHTHLEATSTIETTLTAKALRRLAKLYAEAADKFEKSGVALTDDFAAD